MNTEPQRRRFVAYMLIIFAVAFAVWAGLKLYNSRTAPEPPAAAAE